MHSDVRDIKAELANVNNNINKRIDDTNKRIDSMADSINKRFDRVYIIVILNLIGITAFLIKAFFFYTISSFLKAIPVPFCNYLKN